VKNGLKILKQNKKKKGFFFQSKGEDIKGIFEIMEPKRVN